MMEHRASPEIGNEEKAAASLYVEDGGDHTHSCGNHDEAEERRSHHSDKVKANLISRLNRIEGQIRGVKGLIEKDTYCDDVLNQLSAIQSALNGVGKLLLEGHLKSCVVTKIKAGDPDIIDELLVTVHKMMK